MVSIEPAVLGVIDQVTPKFLVPPTVDVNA